MRQISVLQGVMCQAISLVGAVVRQQCNLQEVTAPSQEIVWHTVFSKMADCHLYTSVFVQINTIHVNSSLPESKLFLLSKC